MGPHSIGVDVDDLHLPVKDALRRAAELEFHVVEIPAAKGETSPRRLSSSGRRHLARYVEGLGLNIASLAADMPELRLTDPAAVDECVTRTCEVIDLARDLEVDIVTASVSALTRPQTGDPCPQGSEALRRIGEHADARRTVYAIRPSIDSGDRIIRLLDEVRCSAIQIGLDPAAMVMSGVSPVAALEQVAGRVALFHARDATLGHADRPGVETKLGEGHVDFVRILSLLSSADYHGVVFLRRYASSHPVADLEAARQVILGLYQRL